MLSDIKREYCLIAISWYSSRISDSTSLDTNFITSKLTTNMKNPFKINSPANQTSTIKHYTYTYHFAPCRQAYVCPCCNCRNSCIPTGYASERENFDRPDMKDVRRRETEHEIARRLREGKTYSSITKAMRVSSKTIAKVSNIIKRQSIWWLTALSAIKREYRLIAISWYSSQIADITPPVTNIRRCNN